MGHPQVYMQRRRSAAAAWSPTTPGNLLAWYDFSDLAHIWSDTGGTTGTSNTGVIKRVDDKSGNAHHATEATNAPTRLDNAQNSKTGAVFTAGSSTKLASAGWTIAQPCTIVVWALSASTASGVIVGGGTVNTRDIYYAAVPTGAANIYSGTALASGSTYTAANIHMLLGLFNGASSLVRVDGAETSGAAGTAAETNGLIIGAEGGPASFATVTVMEIAVYSNDIGSTHRGNAQTYGQGKYAAP